MSDTWQRYVNKQGKPEDGPCDPAAFALADLLCQLVIFLALIVMGSAPLYGVRLQVKPVAVEGGRPMDAKRPRVVLSAISGGYRMDGQAIGLSEITKRLVAKNGRDTVVVLQHDPEVLAMDVDALMSAVAAAGVSTVHIRRKPVTRGAKG